jgi:hypothetical protein
MKLRIKNNRQAPYGVEIVGGGYEFIQPGKTKVVDAANPSALYGKDFLEVEAADSEVTAPPASLKAKAEKPAILDVEEVLKAEVVEEKPSPLDHDGKNGKGGSVKGYHATAAKGARRRRSKAARK